jgi:hypothetical protein
MLQTRDATDASDGRRTRVEPRITVPWKSAHEEMSRTSGAIEAHEVVAAPSVDHEVHAVDGIRDRRVVDDPVGANAVTNVWVADEGVPVTSGNPATCTPSPPRVTRSIAFTPAASTRTVLRRVLARAPERRRAAAHSGRRIRQSMRLSFRSAQHDPGGLRRMEPESDDAGTASTNNDISAGNAGGSDFVRPTPRSRYSATAPRPATATAASRPTRNCSTPRCSATSTAAASRAMIHLARPFPPGAASRCATAVQ